MYCYNRWRRIAKRHQITALLIDVDPSEADPGIDPPENWCEKVYTIPDRPASFFGRLERKIRRSMPWKSREMGWWMNRDVVPLLRQLLDEGNFDMLHVEAFMMWWPVPNRVNLPISFTATDIVSRFADNNPQPGDNWLNRLFANQRHKQLAQLEPINWRRASLITTVTTIERDEIAKVVPNIPVEVIQNGVDLNYFSRSDEPVADPPELCFTGMMSYRPNIDAMEYFCGEILPLIRKEVRDVRVTIVGKDPSREVLDLAQMPAVEVTGSVPDVRPYLRRSTVVIAPVRLGAGMRNKHLEAMAMAKPVVATTFCVEGTMCTNEKDILLGDDAQSFAAYTIRLLTDPTYRKQIAEAGYELVQRDYKWDASANKMADLLEDCFARYRKTK